MFFERLAEKLKDKTNPEEEIVFKNFEEEKVNEAPIAPAAVEKAEKLGASIEGGNIELKIVRPASFEEVSDIADFLIEGCTVVLNLELIDKPTTVRMLDFLNGVTYTKDGEIKSVAQNTYLITPSGIDVRD